MLSPGEKAYYRALLAIRRQDYRAASDYFDQAAEDYASETEFCLFREANRLLVAVKKELGALQDEDRLEIEEAFPNG